tara:strand:- start:189 stop:1883 length:1695 start_codon:yes stop_codon:yes gene_type:complete
MKTDLIILFSFYSVSIISTFGYGSYLQKIINIPSNKRCLGYSLLIGFFFLTIYSYFSNFLYEHNIYHNLIILILGLYLFYLINPKKLFQKKNFKILVFLFLLLFISFLIFKSHDDFPYYHFPYTYYLTQSSSFVGIGQFNHGFRTPSSLFYFNSLFYLPVIKFHLFHIGSAIIYGSAIYILFSNIIESIKKKDINYFYYYNLLALIFILVFFYRLAEHGTDRSAQILILLIITEIFKIFISKKISNYEVSIISILFAITISLKAFYFLYGLLLLPLLVIVSKTIGFLNLMNKILSNRTFYFSLLLLAFVLITNFLNTGCLIYPLVNSCFTNFDWSIQPREIELMKLHYEGWSKAGKTPNFVVNDLSYYVNDFNWVNNWINKYFLFKVSDFLLGLITLIIIFFATFQSKKKVMKNFKKEIIYLYFTIIILLIEWFVNHPALRYGGYSLIAASFFIPFSLVLEKYKNQMKLIKKKTFIIILIAATIFGLRNFDRIIDENKKYNYNVFLNPYYDINATYFRIEKKIDNIIKNYENCLKDKNECDKNDEYFIKKKMGKYIFVRKKDKF